jgi:hypothetical protein
MIFGMLDLGRQAIAPGSSAKPETMGLLANHLHSQLF